MQQWYNPRHYRRSARPAIIFFSPIAMSLFATSAYASEACKALPLVVSDQYEYADCVKNGLATVSQNGKQGIVDTQGKVRVPVRYDSATASSDGTPLASVCMYEKCGFVSTLTGKLVIPMKYTQPEEGEYGADNYEFQEGLSAVMVGEGEKSKYGFIDTAGNTVVPFEYTYANNFHQGLAQVNKDNKWGMIDKNNQIVIPLYYDTIGTFNNGLAPVNKYEKWGFINAQNKLVIPYKYDYADSFSEGLAAVGKANENGTTKIGFINPQGVEVIPQRFGMAGESGEIKFTNGKAWLLLDDVNGYVDKSGKFTPTPDTDTK